MRLSVLPVTIHLAILKACNLVRNINAERQVDNNIMPMCPMLHRNITPQLGETFKRCAVVILCTGICAILLAS